MSLRGKCETAQKEPIVIHARISGSIGRKTYHSAAGLTALIICTTSAFAGQSLRLRDYLNMVLENNETIQAQLLGTEAARHKALAERGAFEPELVTTLQNTANDRPNSVEQQRNLSGIPVLNENNRTIDTGIETLTVTGAKVRLGYTLNNFRNNLQPLGGTAANPGNTDEWQSFAGINITQPLLKNGGRTAALANLRLAAIQSESAFQEYRRQLMVTLSQAEVAYWTVYFAQEQLRFLDESVSVAESLLNDSREKVKAGKGAELDVLEADAGLALRRTKRSEAAQRHSEAISQMLVQAGISPRNAPDFTIADRPQEAQPATSLAESWSTAKALNPDYLIQKKKLDEALLKVSVAKNMRLPELNLKASAGLNGLGDTARSSFEETAENHFASWSVGLEMRVPLGGGIRGDHEYRAAQLGADQVRRQIAGVETQLGNALNVAMKKMKTSRSNASEYRTMIKFSEDLLKSERERVSLGKVEGRRILEVEAGLYEVKQGLAEAQVAAERAALELHLAEGSTLQRLGMNFTADQLRDHTQALLSRRAQKPPTKWFAKKTPPPPKPKFRFTPSHIRLPEPEPANTTSDWMKAAKDWVTEFVTWPRF